VIVAALDSETWPIRPGCQAPRVVCVQVSDANGSRILSRAEGAEAELRTLLGSPEILIVGHNVAFDALATIATWPDLLPLWLAAYESDRVTDTLLREKLGRIAQGTLKYRYPKNDLRTVAERYRIAHDFAEGDKTSAAAPRTRFWEVDGRLAADYPEDFRRYALADLVAGEVCRAQEDAFPAAWLVDQFRQSRGAFFLAYTSAWGMRTDPRAVEALGLRTEAEHKEARALLTEAGIVRPVGTKDTKAAARRMMEACAAAGLPIPRTKIGKQRIADGIPFAIHEYVALDADACAVTLDPVLIAYARFTSISTLRGRVDRLRLAAAEGLPVQPYFDPLKETGRTSASMGEVTPGEALKSIGDQVQNLPREPGLRECYVAREGYWIASADWRAAELHGLAQTCLDLGLDSQLARVLNSGQDVHLWYACQINGWDYAWAAAALKGEHGPDWHKRVKEARQGAKPCMFGFPGGLGIEKFRAFARKQYQVVFSEAEAAERKGIWLSAFPEMGPYLRNAADLVDSGRPLIHFGSWRYRGVDRFTAAANSYFQGRIADMLKDAGWRLTCRFLPGGDLHDRGRPWNQAHDEILAEVRIATAHETVGEIVRTMEQVGAEWCPGCPVKAEGALQIHWRKGAEPAHDPATGRLIPHEHRALKEADRKKIRDLLDQGKDPIHISWALGIDEARVFQEAA
jgi:hypothetical protein